MAQANPKFSMPLFIAFSSQKVPVFVEKKNSEIPYILFGKDNDYPDYLLKLYNRSAKHNSIINGKVNYILGNGWEVKGNLFTVEKKSIANQFLKGFNNESLNDLTKKTILDFELFGGFALEIIWDKAGKKIADLNHVDFSKVRSNKNNSEFYYTNKWLKTSDSGIVTKVQKPEENDDWTVYESFDIEKRKGKQLLYFKSYRPNLDVYPLPEYLGANTSIETDIEISNYHFNNLKNGFTATVLINFNNGLPTAEEKAEVQKQIEDKLTGSDNAGKFILSFADGKEKSAEVIVLSMSDAHNQFEQLRKDTMQEIFIGHRVNSPMLMGVRVEGQLGGRTELIEANELFQNIYVNEKQRIFNQVFTELIKINGFEGELVLTKSDPIGLDWFGDDNLFSILTPEEKREKAGLPPIKKEVVKTIMHEFYNLKLDDKKDVEAFKKYGKPADVFEVLNERSFLFESQENQIESEQEFLKQSFAIQIDIKTLDRNVLDLINKDSLIPSETLASVLKTDKKSVNDAIERLVKKGLIKRSVDKIGDDKQKVLEPTKKGEKVYEEKPAKTVDIFIKYKYAKRPGVTGPNIIPTTREFCREIIGENKLYDREEIETLSNEVGYSVWLHRGGFYRLPKTGEVLPYCRHEWKQVIVKEIS